MRCVRNLFAILSPSQPFQTGVDFYLHALIGPCKHTRAQCKHMGTELVSFKVLSSIVTEFGMP